MSGMSPACRRQRDENPKVMSVMRAEFTGRIKRKITCKKGNEEETA
jgi:hypothetical protein